MSADVNRRRRLALALAALAAGPLGLLLGAVAGVDGYTSFAYVLAIGPPAAALPFALAGWGRFVVLGIGALALLVDLLLLAYSGYLFVPSAGLLVWSGSLPTRPWHHPR